MEVWIWKHRGIIIPALKKYFISIADWILSTIWLSNLILFLLDRIPILPFNGVKLMTWSYDILSQNRHAVLAALHEWSLKGRCRKIFGFLFFHESVPSLRPLITKPHECHFKSIASVVRMSKPLIDLTMSPGSLTRAILPWVANIFANKTRNGVNGIFQSAGKDLLTSEYKRKILKSESLVTLSFISSSLDTRKAIPLLWIANDFLSGKFWSQKDSWHCRL